MGRDGVVLCVMDTHMDIHGPCWHGGRAQLSAAPPGNFWDCILAAASLLLIVSIFIEHSTFCRDDSKIHLQTFGAPVVGYLGDLMAVVT